MWSQKDGEIEGKLIRIAEKKKIVQNLHKPDASYTKLDTISFNIYERRVRKRNVGELIQTSDENVIISEHKLNQPTRNKVSLASTLMHRVTKKKEKELRFDTKTKQN